jgi:hypothetical protein
MRPGPSIALKLTAGIATLALSVHGWHSPEMAVAGGALLVRAGFDLARTRPTKAPPIPRRPAPPPSHPPAGPARPGGRAARPDGAARVAAWARGDRRTDPGAGPPGLRLARRPAPADQRQRGRQRQPGRPGNDDAPF